MKDTLCHGFGENDSCPNGSFFAVKNLGINQGVRTCSRGEQCPFQQARAQGAVEVVLVGQDTNQHVVVSKS